MGEFGSRIDGYVSAARAALAGDIVRPRVARGAFNAFTMSSAERRGVANLGRARAREGWQGETPALSTTAQ